MKTPSAEKISTRAYELWEERGRPDGDEASVACWLAAERELTGLDETETEAGLDLTNGPDVSNLESALPPSKRSQARQQRRGENRTPEPVPVKEHFIVVADQARLRIYRDDTGSGRDGNQLQVAESYDRPHGRENYTDRDTDQAGRFPGGKGAAPGGSIDERLPMLEEQQRRAVADLATRINGFLRQRPEATWDFAAGPIVHNPVLNVIEPGVRSRLRESLIKELAKQPLTELRSHFRSREALQAR